MQTQKKHMIDILFPIILFFIFAISAIIVLLLAANVYRSTAKGLTTDYLTGTSLAYVSEKIHQNNEAGAISIGRTSDTQITHNEFRLCYWEGVDYRGACNMVAEYNVFDRVCYNGDDTGALNNWSSYNCCGNVIRYNLFISIIIKSFELYISRSVHSTDISRYRKASFLALLAS